MLQLQSMQIDTSIQSQTILFKAEYFEYLQIKQIAEYIINNWDFVSEIVATYHLSKVKRIKNKAPYYPHVGNLFKVFSMTGNAIREFNKYKNSIQNKSEDYHYEVSTYINKKTGSKYKEIHLNNSFIKNNINHTMIILTDAADNLLTYPILYEKWKVDVVDYYQYIEPHLDTVYYKKLNRITPRKKSYLIKINNLHLNHNLGFEKLHPWDMISYNPHLYDLNILNKPSLYDTHPVYNKYITQNNALIGKKYNGLFISNTDSLTKSVYINALIDSKKNMAEHYNKIMNYRELPMGSKTLCALGITHIQIDTIEYIATDNIITSEQLFYKYGNCCGKKRVLISADNENQNSIEISKPNENEKNKSSKLTLNINSNRIVEKFSDINYTIRNGQKGFYAYKVAKFTDAPHQSIIKLFIPDTAKIATDGATKYRCDKLIPTNIYTLKKPDECKYEDQLEFVESGDLTEINAIREPTFIYKLDQFQLCNTFVSDLNQVCVPGLHFCLTPKHAWNVFGTNNNTDKIINFDTFEF